MAFALDVIGERWTWLVLRGLLTGPKRFGDLLIQLPGIGTNLLSNRLKQLVDKHVIEKSGSGRQSAYRLTARGEQLRPMAHELIRWGRNFRPPTIEGEQLPIDEDPGQETSNSTGRSHSVLASMPEWDMLAIEAAFVPEKAAGVQAVIEITLSGFVFHLVIRNQICRAVTGPAVEPDAKIFSDSATLMAISEEQTSVQSAENKVRLKIEGDRSVSNLLFELFR